MLKLHIVWYSICRAAVCVLFLLLAVQLPGCNDDSASGQVGGDTDSGIDAASPEDVSGQTDQYTQADAIFGSKDTGTPSTDTIDSDTATLDAPEPADVVATDIGLPPDVDTADSRREAGDFGDSGGTDDALTSADADVADLDANNSGDIEFGVTDSATDLAATDSSQNTDTMDVDDTETTSDTIDVFPEDIVAPEDAPVVPCLKETEGCAPPTTFGPATHVTFAQVGKFGYPGESLNLDPENGDLDCEPVDYCSDGVDNALTSLGTFSNGPLLDLFSSGNVILLVEAPQGLSVGKSFSLVGYVGKKAPGQQSCNIQSQVCEYTVTSESFACMCEPVIYFPEAWIDDTGWLTTGEGTFSLTYPITAGVLIQATLYRARLVGQVSAVSGPFAVTNGVVAGALRPEQLSAAIEAWPSDNLGGFSKGLILAFINGLIADIDTDGDGTDDATSIGLKIQSNGATIVAP